MNEKRKGMKDSIKVTMLFTGVVFLLFAFYSVLGRNSFQGISFYEDIFNHSQTAIGIGDLELYPNLYRIFFNIVYRITFNQFDFSMIFSMIFFHFLFILACYYVINKRIKSSESRLKTAIVCVIILVSFSIYLFNIIPPYFLQGGPAMWHNPTSVSLKPFMILLMHYFLEYLEDDKYRNNKQILLICIYLTLATFAKPSFSVIFMPAVGIYFIIYFLKNKKLNIFVECLKIAATFIPSVVILLAQNATLFGEGNNVAFSPFLLNKFYNVNPILAIFTGCLFPLAVLVLLGLKRIRSDRFLSWSLIFITVAWFQMSFIVEVGPRQNHGNFLWGYIVTNSLLYLACYIALFKNKSYILDNYNISLPSKIKTNVVFIAIVLHFLSGIFRLVSDMYLFLIK